LIHDSPVLKTQMSSMMWNDESSLNDEVNYEYSGAESSGEENLGSSDSLEQNLHTIVMDRPLRFQAPVLRQSSSKEIILIDRPDVHVDTEVSRISYSCNEVVDEEERKKIRRRYIRDIQKRDKNKRSRRRIRVMTNEFDMSRLRSPNKEEETNREDKESPVSTMQNSTRAKSDIEKAVDIKHSSPSAKPESKIFAQRKKVTEPPSSVESPGHSIRENEGSLTYHSPLDTEHQDTLVKLMSTEDREIMRFQEVGNALHLDDLGDSGEEKAMEEEKFVPHLKWHT